jgi:hypothetical protein
MVKEEFETVARLLNEADMFFNLIRAEFFIQSYSFSITIETKYLMRWIQFLISNGGVDTQWQVVPNYLGDIYQTLNIWDFQF